MSVPRRGRRPEPSAPTSPEPPRALTAEGDAAALADRLHSAAIHLLRTLRRQDDSAGLSAPRLSALSVIVFGAGDSGLTLGQLAAAEQVKPPSMTRLVRALEMDGLATLHVDANDRRVIRVHATPKGVRLLHAARRSRVASLAAAVATLPARERETLERGIEAFDLVTRALI